MPRVRERPILDRRATFTALMPAASDDAANAAWFGGADRPTFSRWVAIRDMTGREVVQSGGEFGALQSRFVVRDDGETAALRPRTHTLTDERGVWDIVSLSRSALRGAYLELLCTLRE